MKYFPKVSRLSKNKCSCIMEEEVINMIKDRGTIKWTSLMLPEHVEMLKQMWKENDKIEKPIIDPQMMEVFERELIEAYRNKTKITLLYFDNGYIKEYTGNITSLNIHKNTVLFENGRKALFNQIVSIV